MPAVKNIFPMDVREYGRPPKPTAKNPFAQIDWIFKKRGDRMKNPATRQNYTGACKFFKSHVAETIGVAPYFLAEHWDEFVLLRLKMAIEDRLARGEIQGKSLTMVGRFSAIRQTMLEAASYGLLETRNLHEVNFGEGTPETDGNTPYSEAEIQQIISATKAELIYTKHLLRGYQAIGGGQDPFITPRKGASKGCGFAVEANMRWYFERVLNSKAIGSTLENQRDHKSFLQAAADFHGGLNSMYRRWGVSARFGMPHLMPLVIELMHATGLNPDSCLGLKTDCYKDAHPLTSMPYLLYEKGRSDGELQLHISLLESREPRFLKREQSQLVHRVISNILKLTAPVRDRLPKNSDLRSQLLIYEGAGPSVFGEVVALSPAQTSNWCRSMVEQHALKTDAGEPLSFNLVRFRSTKLTEMALEGRDIFEIQQAAGHKSVTQTFAYISKRRLDTEARAKVAKALQTIRDNQTQVSTKLDSKAGVIPIHPIHPFKGILSDCKNVFDPPQRVRNSREYVSGQPCTRFNICLFCHNVVVLLENLPTLFSYRLQILTAQDNNVQNLPHASQYRDSLDVIEALMDPDESPFSPEEIKWAIELAETADFIIDPVLYRGVEE